MCSHNFSSIPRFSLFLRGVLMRIKKLLFIIPTLAVFALVLLFFSGVVPTTTANALTDAPSLELISFARSYGDFVLDATKWTYSQTDDVFISYGNVLDGKYTPLNNEDTGDYQYECRLNLLVEDENGDILPIIGSKRLSKPYDEEGNCILTPNTTGDNNPKTYKLYNGSFKKNGKETSFAELSVTEKGQNEGLIDFKLTNYSSETYINVEKRKIKIGIPQIPTELNPTLNEIENGSTHSYELSIERTFAIETQMELSDVDSRLVFGHILNNFLANEKADNGMYIFDNTGTYNSFTLGNNNVVITDKTGNIVTDYYDISSDYTIQVKVNKLKIVAPVYHFESVYLQNCIDKDDVSIESDIAIINNSKYVLSNYLSASIDDIFKDTEDKIHYIDFNGNIETNFNLSVRYAYWIKTPIEYFTPTFSSETQLYSLYVNESEKNPNSAYECIPVLLSVGGYEQSEGFNNNDNFELICEESNFSSFKINKRTIILYAEGAENQNPSLNHDPTAERQCIPIPHGDFANHYGFAYNERSSMEIPLDTIGDGEPDSTVKVTFKIKDFESFKNNSSFHVIGNQVILNVGEYTIVPEDITDWRYDVTVDESLHYTITPKELTLKELFESQSFVDQIEFTDNQYIIAGYKYECDPSVYQTVELKFSQKLPYQKEDSNGEFIETDPVFSFKFNFTAHTTPGIYPSSGIQTDDTYNFVISDLDIDEISGDVKNVAIRIYNKLLSALIEDIEYDGTTPEIVITGKEDEYDYEIEKTYCTGTKFASNKVLTKDPVNAGTYTVRIKLKESNIYAFDGGRDYIDITFNIAKRKITVTITAKGNKTFGTKGYFNSPTDSNIATYTVEYNGTSENKTALINGDKLGNLKSDATDIKAKPSSYKIDKSDIKNDNYSITFKNSQGFEKDEYITVVKLTVEISDLKDFAKNNACVKEISGSEIILACPSLFGVEMNPFELSYSVDGENFTTENVKKNGNNMEISELREGTTYTIRYTISRKSDYLALPKDCVITLTVTTKLTIPEVEQNLEASSEDKIIVNLYNFQNSNTYFAYIEDEDFISLDFEIPENCMTLVEETDEDGNILRVFTVLDISKAIALAQSENIEFLLQPDSIYTLYVLRKTDDCTLEKSDQQPLTVMTAPEKLNIKKSDIQTSSEMLRVNLGEIEDSELYVIEYIVGESKKTITSILDDDVDLSPIFQKEGAEIIVNDGLDIFEPLADTIYYLKIYKQKKCYVGSEEKIIKGSPIYFEIHTPKAQNEQNGATSFILNISGYFGVGTMAVLVVALVIFTILYSKLRRKWRID